MEKIQIQHVGWLDGVWLSSTRAPIFLLCEHFEESQIIVNPYFIQKYYTLLALSIFSLSLEIKISKRQCLIFQSELFTWFPLIANIVERFLNMPLFHGNFILSFTTKRKKLIDDILSKAWNSITTHLKMHKLKLSNTTFLSPLHLWIFPCEENIALDSNSFFICYIVWRDIQVAAAAHF